MITLKKIYYVWWVIALIISGITILFQPVQLFDYLTKSYDTNKEIKILNAKFRGSSSKRNSLTVIGIANDQKLYFSLFDEDMNHLTDYINNLNIPVWEMEEKFNYDNMENLNLVVPVISFKHSKGVLLIPLGKTGKEVLNAWALSNLYMLLLAFLPLVILSFINKLNKKMKLIASIILLSLSGFAIAQKPIIKANNIIVENKIIGNLELTIYPQRPVIKAGEKCGFKKTSAEDIFCNFFNVKTQSELNSFFLEDVPNTYAKEHYLGKMLVYFQNSDANYYELDSKFIFDNGITKDIYIKYINHNANFPKPIYSIFYLKQENNKITITDMGNNFELGLLLISIKSEVISNLIQKELTNEEMLIFNPYISTSKELDTKKLIDDFFKFKKETNNPLIKLLYDEQYSIF